MKLTIFAATGGLGRQALDQAVAAGHYVTAVVRNPNKLAGEAVGVVIADLAAADPAVLESAAAGADAVVSGLGPRSTSQTCPAGSLGSTGRATTPVRWGTSCLPAQLSNPIRGGREKRRQSCAR
jgi:NAD(P)-dependent dehydrogenase (short-subunit alcohol dehydrogenase family)